ncbi:DNA repair protein RadC [Fulvitalea axinellae]|uniref:DNA repair protein RadC n=1 Tax=Fulvitalea axinellae TaxID=1182444 RepID=A0AAU9CW77_9BACT|nr:DNA repair protein RadC [Fulvitalea axinellae]
MEQYEAPTGIKQWAEEDRPREKLAMKGRAALTNAELLAILIGSGTKSQSAVDLAKHLLNTASNNLSELARQSVDDMCSVKGIGPAKAISITAALELGRRRKEADPVRRLKIACSQDAFECLRPDLMDLAHEEFWVLLLNRANGVLRKRKVSEGGISGTVADPKRIFKMALNIQASAVILAHNHPSGQLKASDADIRLTKKVKQAGEFLEIPVLDHIIYTDNGYLSFADKGLL